MHPNDSYLRASVKTRRVVRGEDAETGPKCSARPRIAYKPRQQLIMNYLILEFEEKSATHNYLTTPQWLRESTNEASAASLTLQQRGHVIRL